MQEQGKYKEDRGIEALEKACLHFLEIQIKKFKSYTLISTYVLVGS